LKIKAIGIHGGVSPLMRTSSFLINDQIVIDAGSIASALSVGEQLEIDHILISHSHLDHIKDLAFLADSVCGLRESPVKIYSSAPVIRNLRNHFFNNIIWPDFSKIPTPEEPTIEFVDVPIGGTLKFDGISVQIVEVNHPVPAIGFLITDEHCSVIISGDTGPTQELWKLAHKAAKDKKKPLEGIITEVSFPNRMQDIATLAGHFTAAEFAIEVETKIPKGIQIYLYHLKPAHWDEVMDEVKELKLNDVRFLDLEEALYFGSDSKFHGKGKVRRGKKKAA